MYTTTPQTDALAFGARDAISQSVPRLADFSYANRASLMSPVVLRGAYRALEGGLVAAVGFAIATLYVNEPQYQTQYAVAHVALGFATVISLQLFQLYAMTALSSVVRHLPRILLGWSVAFAALVAAVFFLKTGNELSRVWLGAWYVTGALSLIASRVLMSGLLRRFAQEGRLYRRAAIFGSGDVTQELIQQLEADLSGDIRICGIFDDRFEGRAPNLIAGYPRLGGLADLVAFGRSSRLDLVIVALPIAAEERLAIVMKSLSVLPADIKLPARATRVRFSPSTYSHVGSVAMIDLHDKPITDWGTVAKWLFDKIVGFTALTLLAPVMALIAIIIKLDSRGPVLFRQKRYGFNNELIEVYKFRSMYTDRCDAAAVKLVTKDDPRVTPVGRFIRKSSLDELPQLFNVMIGNLSLVGPRPHAMQAKAGNQLYDEVVDSYFARHKVKPGITGWAQINGWRGETDTAEKIQQRVAHDLYYIENWSVFLDAYILLRTPYSLLSKSQNAY